MGRLELKFRLGGIPVRIEPGFWIIALVLGYSQNRSATAILVWIACVFFAVIVHELGHAVVSRVFGAQPEIALYAMGGVTRSIAPEGKPLSRLQSGLITVAGPMAGFVFAGAVMIAALVASPPEQSAAGQAFSILFAINIIWGVVNLLPVLPLDGGNIARVLLAGPGPETGLVRALWVSSFVAPTFAVFAVSIGYHWAALLFGFFTISAVRQLFQVRRVAHDRAQGIDVRLDDAHEALVARDFARAEEQASLVWRLGRTKEMRIAAAHIAAVALLEQGKPEDALAALDKVPDSAADPFLRGACLLGMGRPREAIPELEHAIEIGQNPQATDLLAQARDAASRSTDASSASQK